jgi:hypothetical protein
MEEAFESMPSLKLLVEDSIESARMNMDPVMMSSISMNQYNPNQTGENFDRQSTCNSLVFFEEVKNEKNMPKNMHIMDAATDVRNLVGYANFGCGTNT